MEHKVVTRFAPSPTGFMHVGGVRTALYAWFYARKYNGTFILRIEDTDKEREVEGSIDHIIASLRWLGVEWDEGVDIGGPNKPYLQSQRLDSYKKYAKILIDKGLAYTDPYTQEQLDIFRAKAEAEKKPFLYRDFRPENPPAWDGTLPLRLKVPEIKTYEWNDLVRGNLTAGPEALDDFVLIKSDGYPTYNFAHIIDDYEMGVTHIMRADEFIASTPKFLSLYDALEIKRPEIATLPPIMGQDGKKKLGKRDGAKDILDYKKEGYLPEAMMNFLAFIGWNPGGEKEIYSKEELFEAFDIKKIHISGGKFNEEKLDWFNREYIKMLSSEDFVMHAKPYLPSWANEEMLKSVEGLVRERITKFSDVGGFFEESMYLFKDPEVDQKLIVWKNDTYENARMHLQKVRELLDGVGDWSAENVRAAIMPYAEEVGKGNVLWPLRVSLSGKEKSPDPFEIAGIIGKEATLRRITKADA